MTSLSGHCLCGATRFKLEGPSNWVGHCHCDSCRRATSSPITTFIGHPDGKWAIEGTLKEFQSSTPVTRAFCSGCGSPIYYRSSEIPDETHFYAALLDDPSKVEPTVHWHFDEVLPWLHISDNLANKGAYGG